MLLPAAVLAMALIRSSNLRQRCLDALVTTGHGLQFVFWHVPMHYLPVDAIRRIVSTWMFQLFYLYVVKPGLVCAIIVLIFPQLRTFWYSAAVFAVAADLAHFAGRAGRQ